MMLVRNVVVEDLLLFTSTIARRRLARFRRGMISILKDHLFSSTRKCFTILSISFKEINRVIVYPYKISSFVRLESGRKNERKNILSRFLSFVQSEGSVESSRLFPPVCSNHSLRIYLCL